MQRFRLSFFTKILKLFGTMCMAVGGLIALIFLIGPYLEKQIDVNVRVLSSTYELGGDPDEIIILVHGTFSPNADWTRPDSKFVKTIRDRLSIDRVQFIEFNWPGYIFGFQNNTNFVRQKAAEKLSDLLRELRLKHPSSRQFIIGHSHGGNVALYAANLFRGVDGVVTMGTPFIEVTLHRLSTDPAFSWTVELLTGFLWLSFLYLSSILGVLLACLGARIIGSGHGIIKPIGLIFLVLGFTMTIWHIKSEYVPQENKVHYATSELASNLHTFMLKQAKAWVSDAEQNVQATLMPLTARIAPGLPVLCLQTMEDDEARALLSKIVPTLGLPYALLSNSTTPIVTVVGALLSCLVFAVWQGMRAGIDYVRDEGLGIRSIGISLVASMGVAYMYFLIAAMIAVIVLTLAAPISVILRAPMALPYLFAYGSADIFASYLTDMQVRVVPAAARPEDRCILKTFNFNEPSGALRHSEFYRNDESIAIIADWLASRASEVRN